MGRKEEAKSQLRSRQRRSGNGRMEVTRAGSGRNDIARAEQRGSYALCRANGNL